jgi:wyosine [tRNA(Phe)-imidazoG37] synthetase (radical SAM superfamily)
MQEFPFPTRAQVKEILATKLQQMTAVGEIPDVITFAGNGEPTLHPDFEGIIDDTLELRNQFCPSAKVSVLSNSTRIHKPHIFSALKKVDNNILKFDSAIDRTMKLIDQPVGKHINVSWLKEQLQRFEGNLIIQTMFLRGEYQGEKIDNTTDKEVDAWIRALEIIKPKQVMMYSLDRDTPVQNLQKVNVDELNSIAEKVRAKGFEVSVAG